MPPSTFAPSLADLQTIEDFISKLLNIKVILFPLKVPKLILNSGLSSISRALALEKKSLTLSKIICDWSLHGAKIPTFIPSLNNLSRGSSKNIGIFANMGSIIITAAVVKDTV